jgi:hypothetical protein
MANERTRVNYFNHQFLTADDFITEQNYHVTRHEEQNRALYAPGVIDGLEIDGKNGSDSVTIHPGIAINKLGQEIIVSNELTHQFGSSDEGERYLTICLKEEPQEKDKATEEYRRISETIKVQTKEPDRQDKEKDVVLAEVSLANGALTADVNMDSPCRQKGYAKWFDSSKYVTIDGDQTLHGRLNIGEKSPADSQLGQAEKQGFMFFVKGNVAIEGNLYVANDIYQKDGQVVTYPRLAGNDLAEVYESAMPLGPADVVCLDPNSDTIVQSTVPNDPLVLGVISTAPAQVLGASKSMGFPVALIGRVPCKVVAENGPIRRGDLLTTSSTPGHAMKAEPLILEGHAIVGPGTIIGKALGALRADRGMIDVFVFLR